MTDIVKAQSFEEKMMARIRDGIADLITDADLKKIIERGIEEALFKPRVTPGYHSWDPAHSTPSIVEKAVKEFMLGRVQQAVDKWLADNPSAIKDTIEKMMRAGITDCIVSTLDTRFNWLFQSLLEQAKQQGMVK